MFVNVLSFLFVVVAFFQFICLSQIQHLISAAGARSGLSKCVTAADLQQRIAESVRTVLRRMVSEGLPVPNSNPDACLNADAVMAAT